MANRHDGQWAWWRISIIIKQWLIWLNFTNKPLLQPQYLWSLWVPSSWCWLAPRRTSKRCLARTSGLSGQGWASVGIVITVKRVLTMSSLNSKHIYRPEIETLCILIGADVVVEENRRLFCIGRYLLLMINNLGVFLQNSPSRQAPFSFCLYQQLGRAV